MFGGSVMNQFVGVNGAVAVFWVALAVGYQLGFEGLSLLLFAIFVEIVWVDLAAPWFSPPRLPQQRPPSGGRRSERPKPMRSHR